MRRMSILPVLAAFVLAAAGALAGATVMVNRIEAASEREVERLFLARAIDWADVSVDGFRVRLTGTAPDEATRFEALRLAGTVVDATYVIDAMDVDPGKQIDPPDFTIEILRNDDGISVIGLAPQSLDRDEVAERLDRMAGDGNVTDLLETADYPIPDGWDEALEFAFEALRQLPRSKISVGPGVVEITAISDSEAERRALLAALREAMPLGVEVGLDISAPRPVITPFTLRFVRDGDGARFDACSADTESGRDAILAAAEAAGLPEGGTCRLGLGVPSPRWPDAVTESLAAVERLQGGTLTISDADVTLIAPVGTRQRTFDRVVGELEAALPEVFSLHAILPEPPQTGPEGAPEDDTTPEFVASLNEAGDLTLRGRVTDERLRSAVEGFARARFSTAEVNAAMRVAEDLPAGWPGRVLAGLDSMAFLAVGDLVVRPDGVSLSGITNDPDGKAEITRILGEELGNSDEFSIDVEFIEIIVEVDEPPSPQECVGLINAVLAERKITFAPGSATIDSSARVSVDRIAEIMQDCTEVPMEIAGHTDSQGREAMNLGLSQRRAEAVLEALMARRVLVSNLSARGYGEQIPVADNDTEEGREANRRIEFTLRLEVTTPEDEGDVAAEGAPASDEGDPAGDDAAEDPESADDVPAADGEVTEDGGSGDEAAPPDAAEADSPPDAETPPENEVALADDPDGGDVPPAPEAGDDNDEGAGNGPTYAGVVLPPSAENAPPLRPENLTTDAGDDDE